MSKVHELKTVNPYYDMVANGKKKYELRKNDRNFMVGDILLLKYFDGTHTWGDKNLAVRVTHILKDFVGIEDGYCILSISDPI